MSENIKEKGQISIHTENILPIIKKWLYSDKEIFLREMVSNAMDAMTKLKHLSLIGEYKEELGELSLEIKIDKNKKTISFEDNGIGMTREEVKKYINQIAFSGAAEFMEKYKDNKEENKIIGHFGLGFYSAFMVSDKVEIVTKSFQPDIAVRWINDGSTDFEIDDDKRKERGTVVILHIDDDDKEFLDEGKIKELIHKYCNFLPYPIKIGKDVINDQNPLWLKSSRDVKDEEYKEFYKKLFPMEMEPLFWIHLDVEVPFRLKGILYFPKIRHELDSSKGRIKLYCNQVFVSDHAKEIIPEFLTLLQGTLDIPDLPLNVSRSYLQNDPYVKKISEHITKKVADKLSSLFGKDRANFEKFWEDISIFVKFGMMNDEKFYEKVKEIILYKTTDGVYKTLPEYLEKNKGINKQTNGKETVFYASNEKDQITYINYLKSHGMEAVILGSLIDTHFIQFLEMKDGKISFNRVDSDTTDHLSEDDKAEAKIVDGENKTSDDKLKEIFESALKDDKTKVTVKVSALKNPEISGMIVLSEYMRRFKEMSFSFNRDAGDENMFNDCTLVVNSANDKVKKILELNQEIQGETINDAVNQIYDLALLSQNQLKGDRLVKFIERSNKMLAV